MSKRDLEEEDFDGWRTYDTDEPLDSRISQELFKWIETGTKDIVINGKTYVHPAIIEDHTINDETEGVYVARILQNGKVIPYAYTVATKSLATDYIDPDQGYSEPFNYEGFTPNESINIYSWIKGKEVKHDIFLGYRILKYTNDPKELSIRDFLSSDIKKVRIIGLWPENVENQNFIRYQMGEATKLIDLPPVKEDFLELYHVSIKHPAYPGLGVRASRDIPKGKSLGCYAGDFYPHRFIASGADYNMVTHDDKFVIDASKFGNITRFFNDPTDYAGKAVNTQSMSVFTVGKENQKKKFESTLFKTLRDIKKGEEIFIRYSHEQAYFDPSDFDWEFETYGKIVVYDNKINGESRLRIRGNRPLKYSKKHTWLFLISTQDIDNIDIGITFISDSNRFIPFNLNRDRNITYLSVKLENDSYTLTYNGESYSYGFKSYEEYFPYIDIKHTDNLFQSVKLLNSKIN
jgi:hypothetical protein